MGDLPLTSIDPRRALQLQRRHIQHIPVLPLGHGACLSSSSLSLSRAKLIGSMRSQAMETAEKLKTKANECFHKGKLGAAIDLYTEAPTLCPKWPVPLVNRALCHKKKTQLGGSHPRLLESTPT